jgi:hypothetical protein
MAASIVAIYFYGKLQYLPSARNRMQTTDFKISVS